jgi:hypothetical protein
MKKKNKNSKNSKLTLKALFVALLMALGGQAFAAEREGVVLFKESTGSEIPYVYIYLDTDGDNNEDVILSYEYPGTSPMIASLHRRIQEGSIIIFDDNDMNLSTKGFNFIRPRSLYSINGKSILEIIPNAQPTWFPYATKKQNQR